MKLLDDQVNADFLSSLGIDAVHLLCRGDIDTLARRYGYAVSFGREPASAIRDDLAHCLSKVGVASLVTAPDASLPSVVFYKPNGSNLVGAIECLAPAEHGAALQVALVVTTDGTAHYVTLEGIDAFRPEV